MKPKCLKCGKRIGNLKCDCCRIFNKNWKPKKSVNSMKTIAELKAEIVEHVKQQIEDTLEATLESLSQKIDSDVGKCEEVLQFGGYGMANVLCKSVPPEQKCEGCKRALEIKRWLE